jgi:membrane-associated phospholipid phosphatase/predicted MFS family arabinose efflux permease
MAAVGVGAARALTTSFLPVLLERAERSPELIGVLMLVNPLAGFAIPLLVGIWRDRRPADRHSHRLPFIVGGSLLTGGGLVAIGLGTGLSYLVLVLAGAATYVGLNATATAHRAIIVEGFEDKARPAATSAQELAMIVGGLLGIVAGGAFVEPSAPVLFVGAAVVVPLLAVPTLAVVKRRAEDRAPAHLDRGRADLRTLAAILRQPGPRDVLVAQILWVAAYAALPVFFVLYAREVLGLGAGVASLALAAIGLATGAGMLLAGRASQQQVYPLLVLGAALLGGGLLAAAPFGSLAAVAPAFTVAAVGFGLVTALGFPFFARFIPEGRQGSYSGAYFSARAIAATIALPLSGLLVGATGSYRALLLPGIAGLFAVVPLLRLRPQRTAPEAEAPRRPVGRVGAVIPCYCSSGLEQVLDETLRHVEEVVLVDDGSPPEAAAEIDRIAQGDRVRVLRLGLNGGKGSAVARGAAELLAAGWPVDAILVIDCDGQHPPELIPDFIEAAEDADAVIGNRSERGTMPRLRRFTNRISSTLLSLAVRQRVPDSQCGMRLFRVEVLGHSPLPIGGYEAETRHLKALVRAGARIDWVEIPAIYGGGPTSFRALPDGARVIGAIFGRPHEPGGNSPQFIREWSRRLATLLGVTMALGAMLPLLGPVDERLFLTVNSLGDGPDWLYRALDPHSRNYVLLCILAVAAARIGGRRALGALLAVVAAAFFSDFLLQSVYSVFDRPRPEEVLGADVALTHGRSWADIASFPSGHLAVTTAIAVAAMSAVPALRTPLWLYVGSVAVTRITFGAHFPLDVAMGAFFGYEVGRFSAALSHRLGLLGEPADALPFGRFWRREGSVGPHAARSTS